MSDTPLIDRLRIEWHADKIRIAEVFEEMAELERENAALREEIESLKSALEALTISTMTKEEQP